MSIFFDKIGLSYECSLIFWYYNLSYWKAIGFIQIEVESLIDLMVNFFKVRMSEWGWYQY